MRNLSLHLLTLASIGLGGCSDSNFPGEGEEVLTAPEDVPEIVRETARAVCARLGEARCAQWYWDREDRDWECTVVGLSREAELDISPDGSFSELELRYELAEVERILPDVADLILDKSRGDRDVIIELSLRRDALLDDPPGLEQAWSMSGVVLEFQCPNGRDFELDSRQNFVTRAVDDTSDAGR